MSHYDAVTGRRTTGHLADACYFMMHSETTGRALVADRVLGFCLAGALIAELLDDERVSIEDEQLVDRWKPGDDDVPDAFLREVYKEIVRKGRRSLRDWLDHLSVDATTTVTRRMRCAGLLYYRRRPLGRVLGLNGWLPENLNASGSVTFLLSSAVLQRREDANIAMLFGLMRAAGLNHPMLDDIRHVLHDPVESAVILTQLDPRHRTLLTHIEAAVNSAVLSNRL